MNLRTMTLAVAGGLLYVASLQAQNLSSYRKFAFGADVATIATQLGLKPSDAKTVYQRPALIQDIEWQPYLMLSKSVDLTSVKEVDFRFYNGELFRITVTYDRDSTAGMTVDDMIEAMSVSFGTATRPTAEMVFPSIYQETGKVLARWEDSQYSFNLFRSTYPPTYGLVATSKRLDSLATSAIAQAKAIEAKDAPQREIDRRQREEEALRLDREKLRIVNKAGFRP